MHITKANYYDLVLQIREDLRPLRHGEIWSKKWPTTECKYIPLFIADAFANQLAPPFADPGCSPQGDIVQTGKYFHQH